MSPHPTLVLQAWRANAERERAVFLPSPVSSKGSLERRGRKWQVKGVNKKPIVWAVGIPGELAVSCPGKVTWIVKFMALWLCSWLPVPNKVPSTLQFPTGTPRGMADGGVHFRMKEVGQQQGRGWGNPGSIVTEHHRVRQET
jgi:hypothetical protein